MGAAVGGLEGPSLPPAPAGSASRPLSGRSAAPGKRHWLMLASTGVAPRAFQPISLVLSRSKPPNSLAKNFAEGTMPTEVQDAVPTLSLKCLST